MSKKLNEAFLRDELASSAFFIGKASKPADELTSQPASQLPEALAPRPDSRPPSQSIAKLVGQRPGHAVHGEPIRVVEEHAYDIYQDQARWLNRTQLHLEEDHGAKVMKYEIVRIAIDLIRMDFEANGLDSQLIRVLLKGLPPSIPGTEAVGMDRDG